jgi:hypothetical protein
MSRHFTPPHPVRPGAMAVGHLAELDPASQLAVVALRLWCDRGAEALARDLSVAGDTGPAAAAAFARFCAHCLGAARRPLMRHGTGCPCLGADEAALVAFLRMAAEGEREEAMMMGMVMLRADAVPEAVALAQQAGLALRRLILRGSRVLH